MLVCFFLVTQEEEEQEEEESRILGVRISRVSDLARHNISDA